MMGNMKIWKVPQSLSLNTPEPRSPASVCKLVVLLPLHVFICSFSTAIYIQLHHMTSHVTNHMTVHTISSYRNSTLGPSGGHVELLRNGFRLQSGSCSAGTIINETTITAGRDEGGYKCRVYFPSDPSRQRLVSDRRELIILGR